LQAAAREQQTWKLGDCAIGDFHEMVKGNYQQGGGAN
jgi:hypothetical protein